MLYICVVISCFLYGFFFFFKQKTAYEMLRSLVGSEMCIRDRTGEELGQTASSLGSTLDQQQGQYADLVQMHEGLLADKQQLASRCDGLEGQVREALAETRRLGSTETSLRTQLARTEKELEAARLATSQVESDLRAMEARHRQMDEAKWDLEDKVRDLEGNLLAGKDNAERVHRELERVQDGKTGVEGRLREAEERIQGLMGEAREAAREGEAKLSAQRRELEGFAASQRGELEEQQHQMRVELEEELGKVQRELRESRLREEQSQLDMAAVQEEVKSYKGTAAGQAFSSKIHQVLSRKHKQTGEELGQTASSLGSSVEAQQQQYEHLSQKHETVLQERQQLQVALSKSEGARKSMENRHDQEMGQLREILNGLLRCSSVLGKEP
eukprot:TRINITY_DN59747_c0_g1_i1.p1 TRINITY_DN59747_c0_g1~~TRINITY_DN59747_c0_g1_i1.p1  ORF type:complete len:386 (-),score=149.97 TRINITY_DN59747_c0_g1_i1:200-1357(-)